MRKSQTNVYPNAQKRKVRPFEGMNRRAVVIVPSEEDYKARQEAQEKAGNKDVPESAVMEMKGIKKAQQTNTLAYCIFVPRRKSSLTLFMWLSLLNTNFVLNALNMAKGYFSAATALILFPQQAKKMTLRCAVRMR